MSAHRTSSPAISYMYIYINLHVDTHIQIHACNWREERSVIHELSIRLGINKIRYRNHTFHSMSPCLKEVICRHVVPAVYTVLDLTLKLKE